MDSITIVDAQLGNSVWNVYYSAENRQKRIQWASGATFTRINKLYSYLQDLLDELGQMDDGVIMSAQTPTEYTIGIIDAGDKDPWFIDRTSVEHLTGGALKTASWDRVDGTNTGIVRLAYTVGGTDFDTTDIGRDIKDTTDNDIGTLLDFNTVSSTKYAWIRPDTNAAGNSFDSTAGTHTLAIQQDELSQVWQVVASGPTYVDETVDANSPTANDWTIFPAGANADYAAIGFTQKFKKLTVNVGTAGTGTYTVTWQYWNGAWTSLSGVSDGTNSFKTAGTNNVTFTVPSDWVASSINGSQNLFYIRALKDTGTVTLAPLGTEGWIGGTGSVTQTAAAAISAGESLWANIYSIGTIEKYTHIYVYQKQTGDTAPTYLKAYKSSTSDWWGDQTTGQLDTSGGVTDHIDILVCVKELGQETDEGWIKVFARQYSKTYSYYTVDLSSGGRNPIPLQTGNDLDNQTGFRTFTGSSGSGTFTVGNYIYWDDNGTYTWTTTTKRAKITAVGGTGAAPIITYYLLGEPITDFTNGNNLKEYTGTADGDGDCVAGTPAAAGPSTTTELTFFDTVNPPTVEFGGATLGANGGTFDIDENGTPENYSIVIDCNQNALSQVYQWTKYITRRGSTGDIDPGSAIVTGESYLGSDYRIVTYNSETGSLASGDAVTQGTSSATVVYENTTDNILILRDSRGTFTAGGGNIQKDGSNYIVPTGATISQIAPIGAAPFGTFAGGKFFAAPGVVLSDVKNADANNYQLTTDEGNVVVAPTKVTITVSNTRSGDKVAVFRLDGAGGSIKKTPDGDPRGAYNATVQTVGVTSAIMGSAIAVDEPGRSAPGGILRLVDTSNNAEYRIRYQSWSSSTFTLASTTGLTADAGSSSTVLIDAGTDFTAEIATGIVRAKVGDIIRNITEDKIAYVVSVDSATQLTTTAVGNWTGDSYELNTLPVSTTTTPQDTWYVPLIDSYETTGSDGTPGTESATVTFNANIPARIRARRSTYGSSPILPYESDSTVTNTGMSVSIVRTTDSILSSP